MNFKLKGLERIKKIEDYVIIMRSSRKKTRRFLTVLTHQPFDAGLTSFKGKDKKRKKKTLKIEHKLVQFKRGLLPLTLFNCFIKTRTRQRIVSNSVRIEWNRIALHDLILVPVQTLIWRFFTRLLHTRLPRMTNFFPSFENNNTHFFNSFFLQKRGFPAKSIQSYDFNIIDLFLRVSINQ